MPGSRDWSCLEIRCVDSVAIHDPAEKFHEPSGLSLQPDTGMLWAVSDNEKRLFLLGQDGRIAPESALKVGDKDLEGIAWLGAGRLAVVQEADNEILIFEPGSKAPLARKKLADMENYGIVRSEFEEGGKHKGLEGITSIPDTGALFVVKEGEPRMLLEISPDLSRVVARHVLSPSQGFVADGIADDRLDVSGLCYDSLRKAVWIVSDTGCCVFLYDLHRQQAISAPLIHGDGHKRDLVRNAEGISLDATGRRLFVVTDDRSKSRLLTFDILRPEAAS